MFCDYFRTALNWQSQERHMWDNENLLLYHGTTEEFADKIVNALIAGRYEEIINKSNPLLDFGPGFYTTTNFAHAVLFATFKARTTGFRPQILEFLVNRDSVARAEDLVFASADDSTGFRHYVHLCHNGRRPSRFDGSDYDIIIGPITKFTVDPLPNTNQYAFVTERALRILRPPVSP